MVVTVTNVFFIWSEKEENNVLTPLCLYKIHGFFYQIVIGAYTYNYVSVPVICRYKNSDNNYPSFYTDKLLVKHKM